MIYSPALRPHCVLHTVPDSAVEVFCFLVRWAGTRALLSQQTSCRVLLQLACVRHWRSALLMSATPPHSPGSGDQAAKERGGASSPVRVLRDDVELQDQPRNFLIQRVTALERQLKIRNADCARLLNERQQLLPLRDRCASQKEVILALRSELELAQAQRESALLAVEGMRSRQRDDEHRRRVERFSEELRSNGAANPAAISCPPPKPSIHVLHHPSTGGGTAPTPAPSSRVPGGTVVSTSAGPQVIYDSSDISSVGFHKKKTLPYDFLGGPGAQQQYMVASVVPARLVDASEDAQTSDMMAAVKEEVGLDAQYAELRDEEERSLQARLKALRDGRP